MRKEDLLTLKGQKVAFKVVSGGQDLKVKFTDSFPDYKVKLASSKSFAKETIKIKIVDNGADVKLKKVTSFGDFEAFIME